MRYFGKVKWFGGYNSTKEANNNFGFIEDENGNDVYVHRSEIKSKFLNDEDLEDSIVTFEVLANNQKKKAVNLNFITDEKNIEVLKRIFLRSEDICFKSVFPFIVKFLNDEDLIDLIDNRLTKYGTSSYLEKNIPEKLELLILKPNMLNLRERLSIGYRFKIYKSNSNSIFDLSDEIIQLSQKVSAMEWAHFCRAVKDKITYQSELYKLAPDTVKVSICKAYFNEWLSLIEACSQPIASYQTAWSCEEIYNNLSEDDKKLAMSWMQNVSLNTKDAENMKMISARGAEKASEKFYQTLGCHVEDVAITQISNQQSLASDWKLYDLLVDKKYLIDVKNARTCINDKNRYVEHCIPRFKENRENQQVIIAGVLSSYVKFLDFNHQSYSHNDTIKFLGETCISEIRKLEMIFGKPDYFSLSLINDYASEKSFIPAWFFEYPVAFYKQRQQSRDKLKLANGLDIPTQGEMQLLNINPIPAYLASGMALPKEIEPTMKAWQVIFYNLILKSLQTEKSISMPFLFLALLSHFLWVIRQNSGKEIKDYSPSGYYELLYPLLHYPTVSQIDDIDDFDSVVDFDLLHTIIDTSKKIMPLGIYDPLRIIEHWIDTLELLWQNRAKLRLDGFKSFKFTGAGLLKGRNSNTTPWVTILAYCGGFIDGKGKCGYSPLVIGKHRTCSSCGYLICPSCGCCNQKTKWMAGCIDCAERMAKIAKPYDYRHL